MGLFDRIMTIGRSGQSQEETQPVDSEQEAMRLLHEGMLHEENRQPDLAIKCYDAAILLKSDFGRAHFNRGNILLELDHPLEALSSFEDALKYKPDSAATHYNLGHAYLRTDQLDAAIKAYQRALTLKPDFADAEVSLGIALSAIGQPEKAIACFDRALGIRSDHAEAFFHRANILAELGKFEEASTCFYQLLDAEPSNLEARCNLVKALLAQVKLKEAAANCRAVLDIQPDHVEALNNLGAALNKLREHDAAIASYRRAIDIDPNRAELHNNLGVAQKNVGNFDDALASYRRALTLRPDFPEAYCNLAITQHRLGKISEALASYKKALELDASCVDACNNLGVLYQQMGQLELAHSTFIRTLELDPNNHEFHTNRGSVLAELGQLQAAANSYHQALEIKPDYANARSNLLFIHNYLADQSPERLLEEARRFGESVTQQATIPKRWKNTPDAERRLRIGFVSADFRQHPVGYFVESVLIALSSLTIGRLELIGYFNHWESDAITARIKGCCHDWRTVYALTDERLAQTIRDDNIDILIDLSGHTGENRLPMFAWKPAPIQVSWLGYFGTTGVPTIDFLIADPWTLPESEEINFTETIWRLPETRLCFTPPNISVDVAPLPALGNGHITFGCFNNLTKMSDQVVEVWARILNAVPDSRLFLKTRQLGTDSIRQRVIRSFGEFGIDKTHLILETYVPRANYLSAYNRIDIGLDPFPYPGGTTTVEALWMGVPVLTLAGKSFLARQGVGLMTNAGLPDWVATDKDDYVTRAISHAGNLQKLASLRAGLREQVLASPIFDSSRFARNFEAALRGMWEKWCREQTIELEA